MNKPIHRRSPGESREALWAYIRKEGVFTTAQCILSCDLDKSTVAAYIRTLAKAGYIKPLDGVKNLISYNEERQWQLVRGSVDAPRLRKDGTEITTATGHENMWRTMKILKRFTVTDVQAASSTERHPVRWEEALTYLRYLHRAGYLKKCDDATFQRAIFQLVRWTGPKPPMIQRIKQVWDQNLKKVVWPKEKTGERDG